jgi:Type VI secretion system/phage-baseplate injector OB domain
MSEDINSGERPIDPALPCLGKVVSYADPSFMGRIEVQLLRTGLSGSNATTQVVLADMLMPFYGSTGRQFVKDGDNTYDNTQKSYGMWFVPPDYGSTVLVIFLNGDPGRPYWIGCVPDEAMNFSVPGLAATEFVVEQDGEKDIKGRPSRLPVAEYNKEIVSSEFKIGEETKAKKPRHKFADILVEQGLVLDDIRGITSSSARRETPSQVFGISTPGPVDYEGPRGPVGKLESQFPNAFISRLGGSTFVMDDGDTTFRRKKKASEGPPEYAALLDEETDGLPDVPHNELIRLRTRTGHQILLHNSEDLIYIGNARGTSWIELSSDGKIDIYAEDSISVHTKQDINFLADRDINFEAKRNLNIKVGGEMHTEVIGNQLLVVNGFLKANVKKNASYKYDSDVLTSAKNFHNTASENYNIKVTGDYHLKVTANTQIATNGSLNLRTAADTLVHSIGGTTNIFSGVDNRFTAGSITHILSGSQHRETAGRIYMNSGPAATSANQAADANSATAVSDIPKILKTFSLPDEEGKELTKTIVTRAPTHEPWPHHENLDPLTFKYDKLDRDAKGRYEGEDNSLVKPPEAWKAYSTSTDTFNPPPPADPNV